MPDKATAVGTAIPGTYPAVVSVEPLTDHRLALEFDNGERRLVDISPLLELGRFRDLANPEAFTMGVSPSRSAAS